MNKTSLTIAQLHHLISQKDLRFTINGFDAVRYTGGDNDDDDSILFEWYDDDYFYEQDVTAEMLAKATITFNTIYVEGENGGAEFAFFHNAPAPIEELL